MPSSVPNPVAAAVGLVPSVYGRVRALPGQVVQLPVLVVSTTLMRLDAARRGYDDLAERGERLIARLRGTSFDELEDRFEDSLQGTRLAGPYDVVEDALEDAGEAVGRAARTAGARAAKATGRATREVPADGSAPKKAAKAAKAAPKKAGKAATKAATKAAGSATKAATKGLEGAADSVEDLADVVRGDTGKAAENAGAAAATAQQGVRQAKEAAQDVAQATATAAGKAADKAGDAAGKAADQADKAAQKVEQGAEKAADKADKGADKAAEEVEQAAEAVQESLPEAEQPKGEPTPKAPQNEDTKVDTAADAATVQTVEQVSSSVGGAVLEHDELPLPDYDHMTLGSLRGRMRSLTVEQLVQIRDYEKAHADRLPIVTMLDNRIAKLASDGEQQPSGVPSDRPAPGQTSTAGGSKVDKSTVAPVPGTEPHGVPGNNQQPR